LYCPASQATGEVPRQPWSPTNSVESLPIDDSHLLEELFYKDPWEALQPRAGEAALGPQLHFEPPPLGNRPGQQAPRVTAPAAAEHHPTQVVALTLGKLKLAEDASVPGWPNLTPNDLSLELAFPNAGQVADDAAAFSLGPFAPIQLEADGATFNQRATCRVVMRPELMACWQHAEAVFRLFTAGFHEAQEGSESSWSSVSDTTRRLRQPVNPDAFKGPRAPNAAPPRLLGIATLPLRQLLAAAGQDRQIQTELPFTGLLPGAAESSTLARLSLAIALKAEASEHSWDAPHEAERQTAPIPDRHSDLAVLHCLLQASALRGLRPRPSGDPHSLYLKSRLCVGLDPVLSAVAWRTDIPCFGHQHAAPLLYEPDAIRAFKDGLCVVELWDRCAEEDGTDRLLGLVKIATHDFYLAYRDERVATAMARADLPVLACNDFLPVVDPLSGAAVAHLQVTLALGQPRQVALLTRQRTSSRETDPVAQGLPGTEPAWMTSRGPQVLESAAEHLATDPLLRPGAPLDEAGATASRWERPALREHIIEVTLTAAHGLQLFEHSLYGETDCCLEYLFPSMEEGKLRDLMQQSEEDLNAAAQTTPETLLGARRPHR
jgi:C2 domain-containing protein 3